MMSNSDKRAFTASGNNYIADQFLLASVSAVQGGGKVARPPAASDDYRDSTTDTSAAYGSLVLDGTSTGRIETAGDKDLFAFTVTAGTTYQFDLVGGSLGNPALRLLNGKGTQLLSNDDFDGSADSQITYTAATSGTVYLEAAGYRRETGDYTLSAREAGTALDDDDFDILINYHGDAAYQSYFDAAAARWEEVITGDLPAFVSPLYGTIEDLRIDASVVYIDGAGGRDGNILGQAGPDLLRSDSSLPAHGTMQFDSWDLAGMAEAGSLQGVIEHEMGHVLGMGTLWDQLGLENNYQYTGENALREYRTLTGNSSATYVPVEEEGGAGTAGGHWDEETFSNELMTGWASGDMALSRMTIGALEDMGYQVNYAAADAYIMPSNLAGLRTIEAMPDMVFAIV